MTSALRLVQPLTMDAPPKSPAIDTCRFTHRGDSKAQFTWRSRWVGIAMAAAMSLHAIYEESFPIELALISGMVLCLAICWLLRRHVAPTNIESTPETPGALDARPGGSPSPK